MFDWFRNLVAKSAPPAPAPESEAATVVVRATGTAGDRQRAIGLTAQQAMTIAVEEAHAAGITDDKRVKEAILRVRDLWKQARNSATVTGKAVQLDIGTRRFPVEPG